MVSNDAVRRTVYGYVWLSGRDGVQVELRLLEAELHAYAECEGLERCGRRYIMLRSKANGGVYFYYFCHGTKLVGCTQPYVPRRT